MSDNMKDLPKIKIGDDEYTIDVRLNEIKKIKVYPNGNIHITFIEPNSEEAKKVLEAYFDEQERHKKDKKR